MTSLPPREQRHPFLRYQGLEYTDADIAEFEERLERITVGRYIRGPLIRELILEFLSTLRFGEVLLDLDAPGTIQFQLGRARRRLSWRQFILALGLHTGEEMESSGLDVRSVNIPYLLARYLRRFAAGRKNGDHMFGSMVITPEIPIIDMGELVRLQICMEVDDTWAWVAIGPERQPDAVAGAPGLAQDAPIIDEGGQADPAPVQAPPPPAAASTMP
ncbi:hypothetical protein Tco_1377228 [Tanacetum coccineum]